MSGEKQPPRSSRGFELLLEFARRRGIVEAEARGEAEKSRSDKKGEGENGSS